MEASITMWICRWCRTKSTRARSIKKRDIPRHWRTNWIRFVCHWQDHTNWTRQLNGWTKRFVLHRGIESSLRAASHAARHDGVPVTVPPHLLVTLSLLCSGVPSSFHWWTATVPVTRAIDSQWACCHGHGDSDWDRRPKIRKLEINLTEQRKKVIDATSANPIAIKTYFFRWNNMF